MSYSTIAVIYNPNSTGSSKTLATTFTERLQKRLPSQKIQLIATKRARHAEELAYEIAKASKRPLIISSSGDGGYHEVVNGAMKAQKEGYHPTTGLLPAGNANDHYHNLHETDLVDLIASDASKKIDLLKITGTSAQKPIERYAHSYIGFGLTPDIGKELNKTKLNLLNEFWIVARALFTIRPVRLKIGKKAKSYDSIIFSNVDKMSKYLKVSQPSRVTDGKFEVTIFQKRDKFRLIILLLKASVVGVKEDKQVSDFYLETVKRTLVQADGEIMSLDPHSQVTISIEKQTLTCVV